MKRLLVARIIITFAGIAVWGYGNATAQSNLRIAGMGILAFALLLRFVPKRWLDDGPS